MRRNQRIVLAGCLLVLAACLPAHALPEDRSASLYAGSAFGELATTAEVSQTPDVQPLLQLGPDALPVPDPRTASCPYTCVQLTRACHRDCFPWGFTFLCQQYDPCAADCTCWG
jgi:hypothetical protein